MKVFSLENLPNIGNPRAKAFVQVTGGGEGYDYICWINQKWCDFMNSEGLDINAPKTNKLHERFDKWLQDFVKCDEIWNRNQETAKHISTGEES